MPQNLNILVVGCGGTGGFVAEGLCRLLPKSNIPIFLIDPDRVEPHNLVRQHFFEGDVGKFKSQAMAERLARQFGRAIRYSVYPYARDLVGDDYGAGLVRHMAQGLIIGCVDNPAARRSIAERFDFYNWWIDAGNGYSSGTGIFTMVSRSVATTWPSLSMTFVRTGRAVFRGTTGFNSDSTSLNLATWISILFHLLSACHLQRR